MVFGKKVAGAGAARACGQRGRKATVPCIWAAGKRGPQSWIRWLAEGWACGEWPAVPRRLVQFFGACWQAVLLIRLAGAVRKSRHAMGTAETCPGSFASSACDEEKA